MSRMRNLMMPTLILELAMMILSGAVRMLMMLSSLLSKYTNVMMEPLSSLKTMELSLS